MELSSDAGGEKRKAPNSLSLTLVGSIMMSDTGATGVTLSYSTYECFAQIGCFQGGLVMRASTWLQLDQTVFILHSIDFSHQNGSVYHCSLCWPH